METLGDPCSKQNLACTSDFKCLSRLEILNSCLGKGTDTISGSGSATNSSFKVSGDKDAFW